MTNRDKAEAHFNFIGKSVERGPYLVREPHASFGCGLKAARELAALSLREVEAATGVSNAYVCQLEGDKIRRPAIFILAKLAALYGIDRDMLLASLPDMPPLGKPVVAWKWLPAPRNDEEQVAMAKYLKFIRDAKKPARPKGRKP